MFLAGILRLLIYGILAYIIYSAVQGLVGSGSRKEPPRSPPSGLGTLVKDDVCGTFLPREEAIRDVVDGRECFFCSQECRNKAKAGTGPAR
jgi:uncharacterized protein